MPQPVAVKQAWITAKRPRSIPMFPTDLFAPLFEKVKLAVQHAPHIVLVGNGPGFFAPSIQKPDRTFCAMDLATFTDGPVAFRYTHDIETPLSREAVNPQARSMAVISMFCLEYTDTTLSGPVISNVLRPKERFVWVSHVPNTRITQDIAEAQEYKEAVSRTIGRAIHTMDRNAWRSAMDELSQFLGFGIYVSTMSPAELRSLESQLASLYIRGSQTKPLLVMMDMRRALDMGGSAVDRARRSYEELLLGYNGWITIGQTLNPPADPGSMIPRLPLDLVFLGGYVEIDRENQSAAQIGIFEKRG